MGDTTGVAIGALNLALAAITLIVTCLLVISYSAYSAYVSESAYAPVRYDLWVRLGGSQLYRNLRYSVFAWAVLVTVLSIVSVFKLGVGAAPWALVASVVVWTLYLADAPPRPYYHEGSMVVSAYVPKTFELVMYLAVFGACGLSLALLKGPYL